MRPPCETVVRRLLPILRALVAEELMETHGWTQLQVANRLGVTQPAISGYPSLLKKSASRRFNIEEVKKVAVEIASGLVNGELSLSESVRDVCELCTKLKIGGAVCNLHKLQVPELSEENCEVCYSLLTKGTELSERYNVLMDVREAVALLEKSTDFPRIIPEVRVNIAMGVANAKSTSEIAGIPGRMTKVRGTAKAFMNPEFGASTHMAEVLLAAMKKDPNIRAVINIKHDEYVDRALRNLGYTSASFTPSELPKEAQISEFPTIWGIKKFIEKSKELPMVIIDKGGYGIEPMAYIFGESATAVARKSLRIAEAVKEIRK